MNSGSEMPKIARLSFYAILLFANLTLLIPEVGPFGLGILKNIDQDGMWRSARFAYSENLADYLEFLDLEIPEDAIVVIPPEEVSSWALSNSQTMQFFLAPRVIRNCTSVDCGIPYIDQEKTYILIMGLSRFPGSTIQERDENVHMYNDTWGVYGDFDWQKTIPVENDPDGIKLKAGWIIIQITSLVLFLLIGYLFTCSILPDNPPWMNLGLGYGLLSGIYSFFGYLTMYLGLLTSPKYIFYIFMGLSILISIWIVISGKIRISVFGKLINRRVLSDYWLLIILVFGIGFSVISIGSGFAETDAYVLWGPKAVGIIADGLKGIISRGTNTSIYPLHVPMLLAMLLDVFGDTLPAAKAIFPFYYLSLLLVFYEFLKKRFGGLLSGLSTLILASMPLVARHARVGYANLPVTYYLVVGMILIITWSSKPNQYNKRIILFLAGLCMAFAIWTRPEGKYLASALIFIVIIQSVITNKMINKQLIWLVIPPLLVSIIWEFTNRNFYIGVEVAESSLGLLKSAFSQGVFRFDDAKAILGFLLKELFNFQTWGIVGLGLIASGLIGILRKKDIVPGYSVHFAGAVVVISIITIIYYILPLYGNQDIYWWLGSGYNRMIMPGITLLWLGISWVINSTARAGE